MSKAEGIRRWLVAAAQDGHISIDCTSCQSGRVGDAACCCVMQYRKSDSSGQVFARFPQRIKQLWLVTFSVTNMLSYVSQK
ncbi:hypothetical protein [Collimonas antrihumi]|uniref:hypothetical protein n=1 Tax=Collimonas antrihumi TaxID=1940615 RepID=UPI001B8D4919|nr:hypothetical protein [Collimonas antrihumi]